MFFLEMLQFDFEESTIRPIEESVSSSTSAETDEKELQAFQHIAPALKKQLSTENLSTDSLYFKKSKVQNAQYSSVYLFNDNNLFCRISFRGQQGYFSISSKYEALIPDGSEYKKTKSDLNYCRISLNTPDDIRKYTGLFLQLLDKQIDAYPADFACCSRFESCSNAKKCINPDQDMAIRCSYRKNLKMGKIFYGVNKT